MKDLCGLAARVQSFQVATQKVKVSILKQVEATFPFIYSIGNGFVRLECMQECVFKEVTDKGSVIEQWASYNLKPNPPFQYNLDMTLYHGQLTK